MLRALALVVAAPIVVKLGGVAGLLGRRVKRVRPEELPPMWIGHC